MFWKSKRIKELEAEAKYMSGRIDRLEERIRDGRYKEINGLSEQLQLLKVHLGVEAKWQEPGWVLERKGGA